MGYSHYWDRDLKKKPTDAEWAAFLAGADAVIAVARADGVKITKKLEGEMLWVNGVGVEAAEPLRVTRDPRGNREPPGFGFCKTDMLPYDVAVTAILEVGSRTLPGFTWKCGGEDEGRAEAREFADKALGAKR